MFQYVIVLYSWKMNENIVRPELHLMLPTGEGTSYKKLVLDAFFMSIMLCTRIFLFCFSLFSQFNFVVYLAFVRDFRTYYRHIFVNVTSILALPIRSVYLGDNSRTLHMYFLYLLHLCKLYQISYIIIHSILNPFLHFHPRYWIISYYFRLNYYFLNDISCICKVCVLNVCRVFQL